MFLRLERYQKTGAARGHIFQHWTKGLEEGRGSEGRSHFWMPGVRGRHGSRVLSPCWLIKTPFCCKLSPQRGSQDAA